MLALAALLLAGVPASDTNPIRPIRQLTHTTWVAEDGAPTEIRALAQDGDGYLWIGAASGLVRFDGVRFVPFRSIGSDTVPSVGVRHLLGSRDGSLWITWDDGAVSRLAHGKVTTWNTADGLTPAWQLTESSRGDVVAGTEQGLALFDGTAWKDVRADWGFGWREGRALWFDRSDGLWVEAEDRVVYRPAGGPAFIDPGLPLARVAHQAEFAEEADGTIWMAEFARSAHTLRQAAASMPTTEVLVGTYTMLVDRKGSLWIGSGGDGIRRVIDPRRIRGKRVAQFGREAEHFTEADGLLSNVVKDLLEDREGNIWVASARGIERFREGSLVPYATRGGLRARGVWASRDSSVWASAYAIQEVTRIGPRGRDSVHEPPCWCDRLAQDSAGNVWGLGDTTVVRFRDLEPTTLRLTGGKLHALDAIAIDRNDTPWLVDHEIGLVRVVGRKLERVASIEEIARAQVILADRAGRIWLGGNGRIGLYDAGKLTMFGAGDGVRPGQVTDLYQDSDGSIWATGTGGINKFEHGRFISPGGKGVPGSAVFAMRRDELGAWWLATRAGLLRLEPGELERTLADPAHVLRYRVLDRLDGLPGAITYSRVPVLASTPDGLIWVGADEGIASIDSRRLEREAAPPHVLVEGARVNGQEVVPGDATVLPARVSDLEIDYTAPNLSLPERLQFRYQLEGLDREWHEVGTRRRAYYTDLKPGSYRFRVAATAGDGDWTEAPASWSFRVLPAWYESNWFKALLVLAIGAIGGLLVAWVQRRKHEQEQEDLRRRYEVTLAERNRISQDLHDTLLQGFAGVTLQLKTAEIALPDHPDVAAETILRVQRLARESLREARERVWDLRREASGEDLAAALERMAKDRTAGLPIEVAVTTAGSPRQLPRPVEDAVFRIAREAIVNAVRHADPTHIAIHLEYMAESFGLEVSDDGCGLEPGAAEAARAEGHLGLSGMSDLAAQLGGSCEVRARAGGGTVVLVELPAR